MAGLLSSAMWLRAPHVAGALLVSAIAVSPVVATMYPPPQATWNMDDCAPGSPYLLNTAGEGFRGTKSGIVGCNTGRRGLSGSFRGTTWVEIEDPANLLTLGVARTVTAWVLPRPGGGIASRGEGVGAWALIADATQIRFAVRVGCDRPIGCLLEVSAPPVVDRWVHVAGVYRRLNGAGEHSLQLFVDGIPAASSIVPASGPTASAPGVTRLGRDLRGNVFRGLIDEVHTFDAALTAPQVQQVRGIPGETLRIAYSHNEAYFLGNPGAELERLKRTGFNTVWAYFMGPSTPATRQQFADECFAHGIAIIAPDQFLAELANHPAVIGFWTIDEPDDPDHSIEVQRQRYLAVKAVTNKRVFVVRADFADVSYRGFYAPDVQDVVAFDLYPYRSDRNPTADVDVGKLLTFSRVSELFINRTTDLDKARLSRYIPVFQGFFDVREDTWLKGDTYASSLFFNRLAGQPRSHGSFIWNFPSAAFPYLMGLGQDAEDPRAAALKAEYVRFAADLAGGLHDDVGFQFYTGHDLAAYEPQGRYTISEADLNNGSGRFAVCADPLGDPSQFDIVLGKGDGGPFRRLYAAFSSVNAFGTDIDKVQVVLSYALPGGGFVEIQRWPFDSRFQLRSTFVDLPSTTGSVTARIRVEWNGQSTPLAGLLGAAFALE